MDTLPLKIRKYKKGLETLKETNKTVGILQDQITAFQPKLLKAAKENAELLIVLEKKNKIATAKAEVVGKEQAIAK